MNKITASMLLALGLLWALPASATATSFVPRPYRIKPVRIGMKFRTIGMTQPNQFKVVLNKRFQYVGTNRMSNIRTSQQSRSYMQDTLRNGPKMTARFNGQGFQNQPGFKTGFQAPRFRPWTMQKRHMPSLTPDAVPWW